MMMKSYPLFALLLLVSTLAQGQDRFGQSGHSLLKCREKACVVTHAQSSWRQGLAPWNHLGDSTSEFAHIARQWMGVMK